MAAAVKSILKVPRQLVHCPTSWLPMEDSHLAELLEPVSKKTSCGGGMRIWFPEDVNGEPHSKNPDDGCGGGKYKNDNIFYIYATRDGLVPNEDMTNVLEGPAAVKALRNSKKCNDHNQTANFFRELMDNVRLAGKNPMFWSNFQTKVDRLEEPCWAYIGLAWRSMFARAKRPEEIGL